MKRLSLLALPISFFINTSFAEPPAANTPPASAEATSAQTVVQQQLIQPLAAKERERSRFSRARLPATERRIHILDQQAKKDTAGRTFVRFAIDEHHGYRKATAADEASWRLAAVTGCVYLDKSEVFVKKGDQYRPAAVLLGKNLQPAAENTCQSQPTQVAQTR
jgi:hypothetical protein